VTGSGATAEDGAGSLCEAVAAGAFDLDATIGTLSLVRFLTIPTPGTGRSTLCCFGRDGSLVPCRQLTPPTPPLPPHFELPPPGEAPVYALSVSTAPDFLTDPARRFEQHQRRFARRDHAGPTVGADRQPVDFRKTARSVR
jgi:hypothetical protein